jgi:CubicO group peptidase (beta-lactamase class C family)
MRALFLIGAVVPLLATGGDLHAQYADPTQLSERIEQSLSTLDAPGGAFAVIDQGEIVTVEAVGQTREGESFTADTVLRFASVTKAMTGMALAQLHDEGRLFLDQNYSDWNRGWNGEAFTLAELAGHVSEGIPGKTYVYGTNRFARLEAVIAEASGQSLSDYFCTRIQLPSGAECHDSPYLGAHAGLRMSVRDMAYIIAALQRGELLNETEQEAAFTPYQLNSGSAGPVALGWFVAQLGDEELIWSFGQDDLDHSGALVAYLPERELGFVLLANSNAISDPYRLLGGDPFASPFLLAFLDEHAPDLAAEIDPGYRTLSAGLTAAYAMDLPNAQAAFTSIPDSLTVAPPPALVFFASLLTGPGFGAESDSARAMQIVRTAVERAPWDRWSLLFAAGTELAIGDVQRARRHYRTLLELPNQEADFLSALVQAWAHRGLATSYFESNAEQALTHLDAALATGVTGETLAQIEDMRARLLGAD